MRSTYLFLMLLFPALALLNSWWFARELKRFLAATPAVASAADLERMKKVVGRQMYAALAQILLLAAAPVVFVVGLLHRQLHPSDVLFIILPSAVVLLLSLSVKRIEAAVRGLDAADDELRRQRDAIVRTWLKKPLPDW